MANLYAKMHDTIQAVNYYEKALSLSRELKKDELISANLSNISNIYMGQKKYDKALALFTESLQIRERIGDSKGIASTLARMGTVYTETGRFKEASEALNRSLKIAKKVAVLEEELSALLGLAKLKALTHSNRQFIRFDAAIYCPERFGLRYTPQAANTGCSNSIRNR